MTNLVTSDTSKTSKILYWISTGLVAFIMVASAILYIVKPDMVGDNMKHLGYPTYLVSILPFTKILGAALLLFNKNKSLNEWVYSALFCNCTLAAIAHGMGGDGWLNPGTIAAILLLMSYFSSKKIGK
jgi:hypothetical protein